MPPQSSRTCCCLSFIAMELRRCNILIIYSWGYFIPIQKSSSNPSSCNICYLVMIFNDWYNGFLWRRIIYTIFLYTFYTNSSRFLRALLAVREWFTSRGCQVTEVLSFLQDRCSVVVIRALCPSRNQLPNKKNMGTACNICKGECYRTVLQ